MKSWKKRQAREGGLGLFICGTSQQQYYFKIWLHRSFQSAVKRMTNCIKEAFEVWNRLDENS